MLVFNSTYMVNKDEYITVMT